MRNCQPGAYYAGAGRRVAEAVLRHISVSDHPTTDIRETCTYTSGKATQLSYSIRGFLGTPQEISCMYIHMGGVFQKKLAEQNGSLLGCSDPLATNVLNKSLIADMSANATVLYV